MKMVKKLSMALMLVAVAAFVGCEKNDWPDQPDWSQITPPDAVDPLVAPAATDNIVVAHRGGSTEAGEKANPDNSISSLKYAMGLGCYASECDIYWTKDDNVIVAHADSNCQINGVHPWEATLAEIRRLGTLANGEQIPTLEEFIDTVMDADGTLQNAGMRICTKLWLDIKNITYPSTLTAYPINACRRACEIIKEKGAQNFVEFICTGNSTVMAASFALATNDGISIGWMSNSSAATYVGKGYYWTNLSLTYMNDGINTGARTIKEFKDKGIAVSVFNVDPVADGSNDAVVDYYVSHAAELKAISTNYPHKLLAKLGVDTNNAERFKDL